MEISKYINKMLVWGGFCPWSVKSRQWDLETCVPNQSWHGQRLSAVTATKGFCPSSFAALYLFGPQGRIGGENNSKLAWSEEETKVF